ncbi:DUF1592 domain-containing protein [Hyalangium sp.]|uniref:DUF1592 domain-containing protein n=1 Tax=Hyalangium sp. TaxID=2028555 RepID=UPI002D64C166|nr:DUF1592 domain-containing protein [Hyalangium sp.]HYI02599.1 DUF1592 domain-containing protein [Hyalangium sp.]
MASVLLLAGCYGNSTQKVTTTVPRTEPEAPPDPVGEAEVPRDACRQPRDPGRVSLHRLNRAEYDNTVRDLLGDTKRPARDFPADDISSAGFDNDADVLSMSPLLLEKSSAAATQVLEDAWRKGTLRSCRLDVEDPMPCARELLSRFARRAWRRPVMDSELERLLSLVTLSRQQGDGSEPGMKLALRAVLLSPHFLYRVELDPAPASPAPHRLTDLELAARLAYFLWSSTPDEPLQTLAEAGELHEPMVLEEQVRRMLADPKAQALVENFAGQWLYLRAVDAAAPDPALFPAFDESLRRAMRQETELFFREFLTSDRPLRNMLDADFTYVNDRLAAHYGLPLPGSDTPRRVSLEGHPERMGLFAHGSLLTVTSLPTRTSPVKRGVWVLEQLLCSAPPAPPPNVEGLPPPVDPSASLRQRMEQHRSDPVCAGCHHLMDPIGFGLENFDAIGRWRRTEEGSGAPVDASGTLPGGTAFEGVTGLRPLLKEDARLGECITHQLLTYALGRGLTEADTCAVADITRQAEARGGRWQDLIIAITGSEPFTHRRGEPEEDTP